LKAIVVKSFDIFCQFGVVVLLLMGVIGGYSAGGVGGAIGGLLSSAIASILIFGVLFLIMDIRDNTKKTAELVASLSNNK